MSVGDGARLTLKDIKFAHTVRVVFAKLMYELSYFTYGDTEYETELYSAGTVVELDKVPVRSGYRFTGWFADEALTLPVTSVTMDDHKSVHAGWERVIRLCLPRPQLRMSLRSTGRTALFWMSISPTHRQRRWAYSAGGKHHPR